MKTHLTFRRFGLNSNAVLSPKVRGRYDDGQFSSTFTEFTLIVAGLLPRLAMAFCACAILTVAAFSPVRAQDVSIPGFWDPNTVISRPELAGQSTILFLTDDGFPPLHFLGLDRIPTGFSVELARAACERLQLNCSIQSRRFDTLLDALHNQQGDAIAAAIPITAELRQKFTVTSPYFKNPARFATRRDRPRGEINPDAMAGKTVAVVDRTYHMEFITAFFPRAVRVPFPDLIGAEAALKDGRVDYLFADGLNLALWIGGLRSQDCCAFAGAPYLDNHFFGEGIGFVFQPGDETLRCAFDYALYQLWKEGKYAELYLRFFPISPH